RITHAHGSPHARWIARHTGASVDTADWRRYSADLRDESARLAASRAQPRRRERLSYARRGAWLASCGSRRIHHQPCLATRRHLRALDLTPAGDYAPRES